MGQVLTDRFVKAKKPGAARLEIPDAGVQGLYFVVQPTGGKSWALRYRWQGSPVKYRLGDYPVIGLAEARDKSRDALRLLDAGTDPREVKRTQAVPEAPPDDTIRDIITEFIARHAKVRNRSWQEVERVLRREVEPAWGHRRIGEIERKDVIRLIDSVVDRGAPVMANRVLAHTRKLFNWAVSRDLVATSVCAGVAAPAQETKRDRVLSEAGLRALWTACDDVGEPFGSIVRLLILTGQRRDEVAGMRWTEVDTDAALWTIPGERAKNGVRHPVPLGETALSILASRPRVMAADESGGGTARHVFTTTGASPFSGFSKAKARLDAAMERRLAEETGEATGDGPMAPWRLHDIRRTVATGLQRLGVRLEVTEAILDHVSGSRAGVIGIYQRHDWANEKRAALEAWERHVMETVMAQPLGQSGVDRIGQGAPQKRDGG
ncbi:tyrosine-type recombinase/integrase [Rhodospira trueperi]|uniref:Site-specific recombinase XerD n=1 Tax=Rhodospira trueperi TaxID=69960 RepID=A0A1G7I0L2_9PROT|nr:site-specific integrase [Rhodospira trueperi]SDF06113.1 Site-specific recombinase XerD [Rhodospira trueperi]